MGNAAPGEQIVAAFAVVGALDGAVFGFVRGLSYLPTLPVAVVEGAILFSVPITALGGVVVAARWVGGNLWRHRPHPS